MQVCETQIDIYLIIIQNKSTTMKDGQPTDEQVQRDAEALEKHLGAPGVMDYAKGYLQMQRESSKRAKEQTAYEEELERYTLQNKIADERIDRMRLEIPALKSKYFVIGDQTKVDLWTERIKSGDLSAYLLTLNQCGNLGKHLPEDLVPNKKIIDTRLDAMSDAERLKWDQQLETQWIEQNTSRDSVAQARQLFHMQDTEEYADDEVMRTLHRAINRAEADTVNRAYRAFDDVFGEKQLEYLTHAAPSNIDDPFVIGDSDLKDKWRSAMDGPDGVLANCFILDQKDPRIPMRVGGNDQLSFGNAFTN